MTSEDLKDVPLNPDGPWSIPLLTGYMSPEGVLYDRVTAHEASGVEEDVLNKTDVPFRARIEQFLTNCVEEVHPAPGQKEVRIKARLKNQEDYVGPPPVITDKRGILEAIVGMGQADRPYLIVQIRQRAPGPIFHYPVQCPKCDNVMQKFTDLRKLESKPSKDKMERSYAVDLGRAGTATMRIATGATDIEFEELQEKDPSKMLTHGLYVRMVDLGGKRPTLQEVQALSTTNRTKLRWEVDSRESEMTTEVTHKCNSCGRQIKVDLAIGSPDFFFPSATQNPWSTSSDSG